MSGAIQIRVNWGPKFVYAVLLLLSFLALESGYFLEKGLLIGGRTIENKLLGHLISEMGIAGFVGFILALTFERLSAGEFSKLASKERDAIKTDVFHYVYGYGIPREITDMIDKQILRTMFIRKNMSAKYTLEIIEAGGQVGYVRARRELSYEVENLTDQPQPFPFVASTDAAPEVELNEESKFISLKVEGCKKPFGFDTDELLKMQRDKELEKYLELPSQNIMVLPDTATKVTVTSQTVKYLKGGCVYLILSNHTCDVDLRVRVPRRDLDVVVSAYANNKLKEADTHDPDLGTYHWNIEQPILAYQGIYVGWTPKAAS
ncbi:MAG TPA: hypothetical protein VN956_00310 [Pyrinomonadaceae bacterium]|nr:hypothetical protein [Pyrinomonadaceae bacterium]